MRCDTLPLAVDPKGDGDFVGRPTLLTTQADKSSTLSLIIQTLPSGSALRTLPLVVGRKSDGDCWVALPFLQLRQTD